jgi:hypothetical protein
LGLAPFEQKTETVSHCLQENEYMMG